MVWCEWRKKRVADVIFLPLQLLISWNIFTLSGDVTRLFVSGETSGVLNKHQSLTRKSVINSDAPGPLSLYKTLDFIIASVSWTSENWRHVTFWRATSHGKEHISGEELPQWRYVTLLSDRCDVTWRCSVTDVTLRDVAHSPLAPPTNIFRRSLKRIRPPCRINGPTQML